MATKTAELEIQLKNAKSISDLEQVLKEINIDLKQVDKNSASFVQLAELSKKANGSLGDVKNSLKSITGEQTTKATIKLGEGLFGAFSIASVASQAFSKNAQDNIQKVIASALQFQTVLAALKPITESLSATNRKAFGDLITGFRESEIGVKLFGTSARAALSATGIGLFLVALTLIISNWEAIKTAIIGAESEQEKFFRTQQEGIEVSKVLIAEYNKKLEFQNQLLEIQGKQESQIFSNKRSELLVQIGLQERQQKLAQDQINLALKDLAVKQQSNKIFGLDKNFGLDGAIENIKKLKAQFDTASQASVDLKNNLALIDAQETKFDETQTESANKAAAAFRQKAEEFVAAEDKKVQAILDTEEAQLKADADAQIAADKQAQADKEALDFQRKLQQDRIQGELDLNLHIRSEDEKTAKQKEEHQKAVIENIDKYTQASLDATNKIGQALQEGFQRQLASLATEIDVVTSQYNVSIENRKALEAQLAGSQGERHDQLVAQIAVETQKENQLATQKKKLQNDSIKAQNKAQEAQWRLSLVNAIISGALGVVNALAAPFPLDVILPEIIGAAAAVEIGVIASNKPAPIPAVAARGGFPGGYTGQGGDRDHTGERKSVLTQLHANEYVAPRWQVQHPIYGAMIGYLENARVNGKADGGFVSSAPTLPESTFNTLSGNALLSAIQSANISVSVVDINDGQKRVSVLESNATL